MTAKPLSASFSSQSILTLGAAVAFLPKKLEHHPQPGVMTSNGLRPANPVCLRLGDPQPIDGRTRLVSILDYVGQRKYTARLSNVEQFVLLN